MNLLQRWLRTDWIIHVCIVVLLTISIIVLYGINSGTKQLIIAVMGLSIYALIQLVDYRFFLNYAYVFVLVGFITLIAVLLFGQEIRGTTGWFVFANLSIQPVEVCKIFFLFTLARFLSDRPNSIFTWPGLGMIAGGGLIYSIPVLLQPDFGSATVLVLTVGLTLIAAGLPLKKLLAIMLGGILLFVVLWFGYFNDTQKNRLAVFINPELDPLRSGYNVTQSVIAVGSGQWFGRGLGLGTQSQLRFLPERETDFIFAVIAEELGFIGSSVIIIALGLLMWRLLRGALLQKEAFAQHYLFALVALLFIHTVINIGMNLGVMPVTGIPLPIVSAGGSSLLALLFGLGVAQSSLRE